MVEAVTGVNSVDGAHADIQQRMRLRFDAIPVSKTRYKAISAPAQKAVVKAINRTMEPFASKPPLARQERELEKVVKELEAGDLSLDRSLELFERGMGLSDACRKQLEEAETRVEMLIRRDGKVVAEPFRPEKSGT